MAKYNLGLVSVSFRKNAPQEILSAMKKANLSFVEWGSDVHAPKDDLEKLNMLAALQKEYGITCSSYGTYFCLGRDDLGELEDYIKAAQLLGTDVLRVWCGNKNNEDYSVNEKAALFNACKKAADIAEKHSIKICLECHGGTYTNSKESALELMQYVNSNNFRMYWQPNQFKSVDENIAYAKLLSVYTENIHVFNWEKDERKPLNDAKLTWQKYLECFENDKTLLLEFMPDDKIDTLIYEADALKEIVGV